MLYSERIIELGLPVYQGEKHIHYLVRLLLRGHVINTRQCRYIGIGNLHSEISKLANRYFPFSQKKGRVVDPVTGKIPDKDVLIIWMSEEQVAEYYARKKTPYRRTKAD